MPRSPTKPSNSYLVNNRTMQMQVDLEGRVRNLPLVKTQGLRPVFEAIVNSIDAIDEGGAKGTIEVRIGRDESQRILMAGDTAVQPVYSFEITDTGVGFTSKNWRAFQQSDTTVKGLPRRSEERRVGKECRL